ncbi:hypothetical protein MJO28_012730 [Puccinia striiformis f. sp. tritici]|uniref:Uncharacterized protein n=1 Tax=Puccinia striiformis f. sp. tritici TaxID=168172 RepID=A0ACC0E2P8_9BASI|nr:hypothetical protein MJO28_012730 [Puccinia striiformis f. sp. tritici]
MSEHKSILRLLTNVPFAEWKGQMRSYLQNQGLEMYIDASITPPTDATALLTYNKENDRAAGLLSMYLGQRFRDQFITSENKSNARGIWKALEDHFEAKTGDNQSRVVQEFLTIKFKGNDVESFLTDLNKHLRNISAVGIKIINTEEFTLHETFISEFLLSKVPVALNIRDLLLTQRPLTIQKLRDLLDGKRRDMAPIASSSSAIPSAPPIKQESALSAKTTKAGTPVTWPTCSPGKHNPATAHTEEECRQLKRGKRTAKTAATHPPASDKADDDSASISTTSSGLVCIRKALSAIQPADTCFLDSGASHHMFIGEGFVYILANDGSNVKLKALHVPGLAGTLISFGRLFERQCDLVRTSDNTFNIVRNKSVILLSAVLGGVCNVKLASASQGQSSEHSAKRASLTDIEVLHRSAGHPNIKALKKLFPNIRAAKINCEACSLSKSHRLPFPGSLPDATRPLEYIYMDLSGRINPPSFGGKEYYFKITDYYTRYRHVFLLSKKSETFSFFLQYYNEVTNFHSTTIKNVIFDGGGEFNSHEFLDFLKSKGISVQVTAPYTPQQNSVAERGNRSTSEKTRCLLKQAQLPSEYWAEAVSTAVLLENITPMRKLKWDTPHNRWFGRSFDINRLKPFGCLAYVNIPKQLRNGKFANTFGSNNDAVMPDARRDENGDNDSDEAIESDIPGTSLGHLQFTQPNHRSLS